MLSSANTGKIFHYYKLEHNSRGLPHKSWLFVKMFTKYCSIFTVFKATVKKIITRVKIINEFKSIKRKYRCSMSTKRVHINAKEM